MIKCPRNFIYELPTDIEIVLETTCDSVNNIDAELSNGKSGEETIEVIKYQLNNIKQALLNAGCVES